MDTTIWPSLALLFGLALVVTIIGFYRVVYFISVGYAFSIVAMAVATVITLRQNLTWISALQNAALAAWGIRLGVYLVQRERQPSYRKRLEEPQGENGQAQGVTAVWWRKVLIWIGVSLLYVMMFSPSLFSLTGPAFTPYPVTLLTQLAGLATLASGLILETVADRQKVLLKAVAPQRFCNVGVYRWVRYPNYLGEIMVWVGNWIMGLPFYVSAAQWVLSAVGAVCIVLIMMGSTKRLERSQAERYGSLPEYNEYIRTVPVLFPFVPIYTLRNVRVYLE